MASASQTDGRRLLDYLNVHWYPEAQVNGTRVIEDSVAPAIAMYAEGKAVKISPDYVERQQVLWKAAVESASRIFVAGVRVHNADVHVWGELARARAPVTC